ncbi:Crp/Fnr family transcriptional regulator [Novosphingobium kaempferiae]|uniref:Crp/Fnr family transcriptional regulator n=1 Tax=Novosphingobium kaempferiae TaxID=2896849 RepID=UPI001E5643AD|nr:Crp/Fnr family transcriptional regulator [Novosphingobium kaempferiae]
MLFEPVIRKLSALEALTSAEVDAVKALCRDTRTIRRHKDVISEGERPDSVHLVLSGWAARYAILPDGTRQITAFLVPGDFCDMHVTTLARMDHSIGAITDCTVAFIPKSLMDEITRSTPVLTRAFWRATLIDEAILRQWLVSTGRRDAKAGIAHLLCELHIRLRLVGLTNEGDLALPLTQADIADATGLTPVHVNRTLRDLREGGLIGEGHRIRLLDVPGLRKIAGFHPSYLHLNEADAAA